MARRNYPHYCVQYQKNSSTLTRPLYGIYMQELDVLMTLNLTFSDNPMPYVTVLWKSPLQYFVVFLNNTLLILALLLFEIKIWLKLAYPRLCKLNCNGEVLIYY